MNRSTRYTLRTKLIALAVAGAFSFPAFATDDAENLVDMPVVSDPDTPGDDTPVEVTPNKASLILEDGTLILQSGEESGNRGVFVNVAGKSDTTTVTGGDSDKASTLSLSGTTASLGVDNGPSVSLNKGTSGDTAVIQSGGTGAVTVYEKEQVVRAGESQGDKLAGRTYATKIEGGLYVNGDLSVNGSIRQTATQSATTEVSTRENVASSKLDGAKQGTVSSVQLVSKGQEDPATGATATESRASVTVTNGMGNTHGLSVYEDRTVISGGVNSTSVTFNDDAVVFRNDATGGNARLTGIADGKSDFDAVNFRQLEKAYAGVAGVAALAAIPEPPWGKHYSLGIGVGHFQGQNAVAIGYKGSISRSVRMTMGYSHAGKASTYNAGVAFNW